MKIGKVFECITQKRRISNTNESFVVVQLALGTSRKANCNLLKVPKSSGCSLNIQKVIFSPSRYLGNSETTGCWLQS